MAEENLRVAPINRAQSQEVCVEFLARLNGLEPPTALDICSHVFATIIALSEGIIHNVEEVAIKNLKDQLAGVRKSLADIDLTDKPPTLN